MSNPMYAVAVIAVITVAGLTALYAFGPGPNVGGPGPAGSPELSPTHPMIVESGRFPEVTIECGGDPGLTEEECQAWAEQLLASGPSDATKLVLTYRTGNSRCAADYFAANGRMLMTAAARCPAP